MRGFAKAADGWESRLETWEREYLAGLLEQVAVLLAADGPADPAADRPGGPTGEAASPHPELRQGESARDGDVLAALDFDPDPQGRPASRPPPSPTSAPPALAPVIDVLLPDASEDPEVALEVAGLTRARLRSLKHERLEAAIAELLEPTGAGGAVRVARGHEQEWLSALNDVRLVLAQRLDIDGPEAAEEVHAVARREAPRDEDDDARWRRGLALSYDMLTWWQESLVTVLLYG